MTIQIKIRISFVTDRLRLMECCIVKSDWECQHLDSFIFIDCLDDRIQKIFSFLEELIGVNVKFKKVTIIYLEDVDFKSSMSLQTIGGFRIWWKKMVIDRIRIDQSQK